MDTTMKGIGRRIREARKRARYSQAELGRIMGVTDSCVSRWENGEVGLDVATLKQICDILGCTIFDLLDVDIDSFPPGRDADDLMRTLHDRIKHLPRNEKLRVLGYIEAILDQLQ